MRARTIISVVIVCLLSMFPMRSGLARQPSLPLQGYVAGEIGIEGEYPKVGDIFEVAYRIKVSETADWTTPLKGYLTKNYVGVIKCIPSGPERGFEATDVVGQDSFFFSGLTIGETKEFRTRCRILKPVTSVNIVGELDLLVEGKSHGSVASGEMSLSLVDPVTGQYGTTADLRAKSVNVFWKYNNLEPQWLSEPTHEWVEGNQKIAEQMKGFEPALTDSEALCLHRDNYLLIINGIGDPNATDSSRVVHLLKAGWLDAQRAGAEEHDKWLNEFMRKNKGRWGGDAASNFFRDSAPDSSDSSRGGNSSLEDPPTTTFLGQWLYQDHLYNKEQGLLWAYETKPIKYAEVGIRAYWYEPGPGHGTVFVGWGTTDIHGNFFIQTNLIPSEATQVHAYPVLYAWGPVRYEEMVKVENPGSQSWPNPRDPTVWRLGRSDGPPANSLVPGGDCDFGVCYPETAKAGRSQPVSGSVNILETYLSARAFVIPLPTSQLSVTWEPGYECSTSYGNHEILVGGSLTNTDEWDDDVLLHEFGHYLMEESGEIPPGCDLEHYWFLRYDTHRNLAFTEGWADFFSGAARIGRGADRLLVNNRYIGSGTIAGWYDLEDPWIGYGFDPPDFEGGPFCEGAVAGVLWDIYDPHNEIPYPCHPADGWPDTGFADSLGMGFDEVWTVFDTYDPPGGNTICWTIFNFASGWNNQGYDHRTALDQILLHHRIDQGMPAPPEGLEPRPEGSYIRLRWLANSEPDVCGYRVYRRDSGTFLAWSEWDVIDEVSDTTCVDSTGQFGVIDYEYKVTAFDELGNESGFSSTVVMPAAGVNGTESPVSAPALSISPNPTGSGLRIGWVADRAPGDFSLRIYDSTGRLVRDLSRAGRDVKGRLQVAWDGDDDQGHRVPPGIYFVRLELKGNKATAKAIILR